MKRATRLLLFLCWLASNRTDAGEDKSDTSLTREAALRQGMFVLSFSNAGGGKYAEATVFTDTTDPEQLQLAERLQELIYRIGSVRLPICDLNHYRGEEEHCILIRDPGMPKSGSVPVYRIFMTEVYRGSSNRQKQIQILALRPHAGEALSQFTKAAFGIPLIELDNPRFRWPKRDVVAISDDFKAITRMWASGPIETNGTKYIDFEGAPLEEVAPYLPALTGKPVIVTSYQGASVTCRFLPGVPLRRALDELAASLRKDDAFLTNVESKYFRIVDANWASKHPAPSHIEIRIEKDQIMADEQPVTMDKLIRLISEGTNAEVEVWVYDAGNSTSLNFDSVGKPLIKAGLWPRNLFREYLPKR
jgi:hypothetical protein